MRNAGSDIQGNLQMSNIGGMREWDGISGEDLLAGPKVEHSMAKKQMADDYLSV